MCRILKYKIKSNKAKVSLKLLNSLLDLETPDWTNTKISIIIMKSLDLERFFEKLFYESCPRNEIWDKRRVFFRTFQMNKSQTCQTYHLYFVKIDCIFIKMATWYLLDKKMNRECHLNIIRKHLLCFLYYFLSIEFHPLHTLLFFMFTSSICSCKPIPFQVHQSHLMYVPIIPFACPYYPLHGLLLLLIYDADTKIKFYCNNWFL